MQEVIVTYTQYDPNPVKLDEDKITKLAGKIIDHSGLHMNCMRVYCSIFPAAGDDHTRRVHFSNISPRSNKFISEIEADKVAPDTYSVSLSTYYHHILNSGATIEKANTCYQRHSDLSTAFSSLELYQQFIVYLKMLLQNAFEIDFRQCLANEETIGIDVETGKLFNNDANANDKSLDEKNTVISSVMIKGVKACTSWGWWQS